MSTRPSSVRAGRTRKPVVAVTGAANGLGAALTERLVADPAIRKVVAIDGERGEQPEVTWRVADVRDPALASKLTGVDVLVHLALDLAVESEQVERRALNVRGTTVALTAAAAAGLKRVVLATSTMVYGGPDGAPPYTDDAVVRADPDDSVLGDLVEIETVVDNARRAHPWLEISLLRPAPLVGPGVDSVVTRHFEAPRLLVLRGTEPLWQFCHVDDLLSALALAALGPYLPCANVAASGFLTQEDVERISGLRRIELPAAVAISTAERLHRIGVTPAAASELSFLAHPVVVECPSLTAAGWIPEYGNEAALVVLVEESARHHTAVGTRRLDRKDATRAAAASATVALVGTAALVRRARKRRRS